MKVHKLLKYGLEEKFSARGVSARRNVLPKVLGHKNMLTKRIGYFFASFYPNGLLGEIGV